MDNVEKAEFCLFKPPILSEEEATEKLSININGYPKEIFKYIDFEDVIKNKYFITSYGRSIYKLWKRIIS